MEIEKEKEAFTKEEEAPQVSSFTASNEKPADNGHADTTANA